MFETGEAVVTSGLSRDGQVETLVIEGEHATIRFGTRPFTAATGRASLWLVRPSQPDREYTLDTERPDLELVRDAGRATRAAGAHPMNVRAGQLQDQLTTAAVMDAVLRSIRSRRPANVLVPIPRAR